MMQTNGLQIMAKPAPKKKSALIGVSKMIEESEKASLRNRIDEFAHLLDQDEFYSRELKGETHAERQSILEVLKTSGAVESVRRELPPDRDDGKPVNVWEWRRFRRELQEYLDNRDELSCGCRVHIPPERDGEIYFCKFCGEGHPKSEVQEAL